MNIGQLLQAAQAHAEMMAGKNYLTHAELERDMAIGLELSQRYIDALNDAIDELDTDYIGELNNG